MALTRIENNQISNAVSGNTELGINGNLKLQEYSVTGSRLANNLNYGSNLTVTGNATAGNVLTGGIVSATGNVIGNYFLGNIACATGYNSNTIYNGTSNVLIATANGNITMSVDGTPNVVTITSTTLQTNNISTSGNAIIGGDLVVNGNLTYVNVTDLNVEDPIIGLGRGPNNAPLTTDDGKDRGEQLWYYAGSEKSAFTGYDNSAGKILLATDVTITNEIVSVNNYGNLVIGNLEGASSTVTGNASAGNVLTGGVVSAAGTATVGNLATGGSISATGDATAGNVLTGGVISAAGTATVGNLATAGTITATGTATVGNLATGGTVSASGDVTGGNLITGGAVTASGTVTGGNVATGGTVSASGTVTGGNLATGGTVTATGNIQGGNVLTGGAVSATGTGTFGNVLTGGAVSATGTGTFGNIDTAGAVSAAGNVTGGNILFGSGYVSGTGNVYAGNLIGNISGNLSAPGANSEVVFNDNGTANATAGFTFDKNSNAVTVTGTITGGNLATAGTITATGTATLGNVLTGGIISATGTIESANNITGANLFTSGTVSATGTATAGNVLTGGIVSATSTGTFGNIQTAGDVTATGAITGGNIFTGGVVSAVSTVTGGNLATAGTVTATGNITGGNVNTAGQVSAVGDVHGGNILTNGAVSAAGTATVGNLATAGTITATGTATVGNLATSGTVSAGGNVTGGNIATAGAVSATGNITADYFFGNGSQLTGIDTNLIKNGNSNVRILTANGNISMDVNSTSNVVVVTDTGINVTGTASASGNVTGQNLFTAGNVSATGDVYANNVRTSNVISTGQLSLTTASNGNINIQPNGAGNIVLGGNTYINGVSQIPVQDNDVASKYYVDQLAATGLTYHQAVVVATTTDLATATGGTITYNQPNGAGNGIGATLTTTGSFNLIDSANVQTVGTRILVKNEGNAVFNGVYTWSNATVITRSTDADEYGLNSANAISLNSYFFVTGGNVNLGSAYVVDAPTGTITFGTSNIEFAQFSQAQIYSANTQAGLSLIGQTFSAKIDNNTTAFDGSGNIIVKAGANLTTPNIGAATGTSLSVTGNITGGNVFTGGVVSATGNITGNYFIGNGSQLTGVTATNVDANALTGNTLSANVLFSSLQTVGNLANLSVIGTTTTGNLDTGGTVSAAGTVTGGNVLTGGVVSATGTGTFGNVFTGGVISATGTIESANTITGGNLLTGGVVSAAGTATVGNLLTAGTVSATGTVQAGNVLTAGEVSAGGSLTGGNIFTGGTVSAVSTITGGNLATAGTITATGTATVGNLATSGTVSATGNVTAGNILFGAGIVSGTGNIYADNIFANITGNIDAAGSNTEVQFNDNGILGASSGFTFNTVGNVLTANGNINGANFLTAGIVSATGNVTGNYFIGNGSQLTGIDATSIQNGNSNVKVYANGNVAVSITGTANTVVFTTDGVSAAGNVTGNIVLGTTAVFGTSFTPTVGATVTINATDSLLVPVGNTVQRPTGVTGMVRFNTTNTVLEVYNGTSWVSVGEFTVIEDDQFAGDNSTVAFTLSKAATTDSVIVSINGVVQIPVTAYSVSGTTLTFTEAPLAGDDIDVRILTTTTTVTGISNSPANAAISVSDTSNVITVTGQLQGSGNVISIVGDLTVSGNATITGNVATNSISNGNSRVQIPTTNGNVNIDVGATDNMAVFTPTDLIVTGNVSVTGNVTAQDVNSLSDVTLKTNIQPISGIESVLFGLNGYEYDWKNGSGHSYGFLAQEVEKVLPNAVKTGADGLKAINYMMIIPFLVETIKQMGTEIRDLKQTVSSRGKKK